MRLTRYAHRKTLHASLTKQDAKDLADALRIVLKSTPDMPRGTLLTLQDLEDYSQRAAWKRMFKTLTDRPQVARRATLTA